MIGNYVLSAGHADAYYNSAKKVQALMRDEFIEAFKSVDVLFGPVSPTPAFKFGQVTGLEMDLQDYFTASANLTGIPALALPCGFTSSNLPVGFQLFGPDLSEELLYQTAYAYECTTSWHTMHPGGYE
jgi:aspartyl-tRNA(Asn)/glutamyl-tRNA(Gln) amidotransferase subunit A